MKLKQIVKIISFIIYHIYIYIRKPKREKKKGKSYPCECESTDFWGARVSCNVNISTIVSVQRS